MTGVPLPVTAGFDQGNNLHTLYLHFSQVNFFFFFSFVMQYILQSTAMILMM